MGREKSVSAVDDRPGIPNAGVGEIDDLLPGVDFSHEILLTAELGLGDTCVVDWEYQR